MGQEASLPQANGDEEFEHQARAPPSSSNPPPSSSSSQQQPPNGSSGSGKRPSAKIMNAVFPKRQQQQQQQNAPVDLDPSLIQGGGGVPPNMQAMTPEQQQQYYHQQQMYQQQMQMQQQQQQQQQQQLYYAQHGGPPQQQQYNQYAAQPQMPQPDPEIDGIMYEHDRTSPPQQQQTQTNSGSSKKGGFMRSHGRGAAIINSMKNLSLGNAMQRASPKQPASSSNSNQQQQQQQQPTVNDWETKWDEDDDDSDDENEEIDTGKQPPAAAPLQHPPMRPGMDVTTTPGQQPSMSMPVLGFDSPQPSSNTTTKSHLVTATPEQDGAITTDTATARPVNVRQDSEDGLEWDTGALATSEEDDRPNVQMFLPLLRVLGKGSFGKVSKTKHGSINGNGASSL
jgi:hypothetical protein